MGQIQKAMDVYSKAMELDPDSAEAKTGKRVTWKINGRGGFFQENISVKNLEISERSIYFFSKTIFFSADL